MRTRVSAGGCGILLWGCLLLASSGAQGQECITCRTEACPSKTTLRDWCGKGPDPTTPHAPARRRPARRPQAVRPRQEPPTPAPSDAVAPTEVRAAPMIPNPPQEVEAQSPAPRRSPVESAPMQVTARLADPTPPATPLRRHPLRAAKWVLLGSGLAMGAAGAGLWAVDSTPTCGLNPGDSRCPKLFDTLAGGVTLTVVGGAALVSSVVMFVLDAR